MKSAKEFWREKFDEEPQTDADKLAVAMMAEYAREVKEETVLDALTWIDDNDIKNLTPLQVTEFYFEQHKSV